MQEEATTFNRRVSERMVLAAWARSRSLVLIEALALTVILGLAAFWRFYHLDYRCLWGDEVAVAQVAQLQNLGDIILGARSHLSAPPLDYLLRHFWQAIAGTSDSSLRAYSGIWGMFSVVLTYLLGRKLFGSKAGLLGALFLSLSTFHVHYSAEVKFYAILVAGYLAVVYTWIIATERKSGRAWTAYCAVGALGCYAHPYIAFAVLYCSLASLVRWIVLGIKGQRQVRRESQIIPALVTALVVVLLYVPWVLWDFVGQPKGWAPPDLSWTFLYQTLKEFLPGGPLGMLLAILGIAGAGLHLIRRPKHEMLPIWLSILASVILVWLLDISGHYPILARQLIFVQPLLLILLVGGLVEILDRIPVRFGARLLGGVSFTGIGCLVGVQVDGAAVGQVECATTGESKPTSLFLDPGNSGQHQLGIVVQAANGPVTLEEAKLMPLRKIGLAQPRYRISTADMRAVGSAQLAVGRAPAGDYFSFMWQYKTGDAAKLMVWVVDPGSYQLTVHASPFGPPPALFDVLVNGQFEASMEFRGGWEDASIPIDLPTAGPAEISLAFANDYSGPDGDRNAQVRWLEISQGPSGSSGAGRLDLSPLASNYRGGVGLNGGELGMYWDGATVAPYDLAPGMYTFQVAARGQQGCGIRPVLKLYADGKEVGSREVASEATEVYEFPNVVLDAGDKHSIGVEFVQPGACEEQGQDVNPFIRAIHFVRN